WRQFSFFDVVPVKDVHDLDSPPYIFKVRASSSLRITTLNNSHHRQPQKYPQSLRQDIHGSIHLLNRDFESTNSWVAHVSGRVTHMVERQGVLVTLGEEDNVKSPLLKIWDMQNTDKKTGSPHLLRSTKVQLSNRPHPVTTIALSASLSHLAIGLGDGTVLLYRHLDQSLASSTSLTSLPKPRTVHESPTEPITGLGFREPTEDIVNAYLFVVTTNRVLSYQASGRGSGGSATVVDEVGSGLGCATMDWRKRDIVVARDEAIYICGIDGRGACYAYEGHKSSVHTHQNYLVIVSPPFFPTATAASATVRNFVARSANPGETDITKVNVFDLENKLVAYSGTFKQGVKEVISQWGEIYVLATDGTLTCLEEKSTADKLDMLYRKSLYLLALNMAKTQNLDVASVSDIHKQYGDHLYGKGDYDGAMQQFVQTIGHLQPSYVIRKFLDAQRIHNLVTYLQELHSLGLANSDHTTLLLNTYTKLKDVSRLDTFIKTESRRGDDSDELPFDLETAIRVCRQAGYFEHAGYLAKKYQRHEDYLRIQIEDAGNYKDALVYLRKLGSEAAESNLARYGRAMLNSLPEETTQLLIDLCTSTGPLISEPEEITPKSPAAAAAPSGPSYLSYLALNRNSPLGSVLGGVSISGTITPPPTTTDNIPPSKSNTPFAPPPKSPSPTPHHRLSPKLYFPHFVDNVDQFLVFLETVAVRRWNQSVDPTPPTPGMVGVLGGVEPPDASDEVGVEMDRRDQVAVWNTLLELYLTLPLPGGARKEAMRVLRSGKIPYEPMHALILCSTHSFTDGLVLLYEKMGMYEDVLRFWMDKHNQASSPGASAKVVEHLMHYGNQHPHLYPLVLRFLTSTPELLREHQEDVRGILEYIDQEEMMSPLSVVQVLSRNGVASVGLVKEWLVGRIKEARGIIQSDQELITSYRTETTTKLKQVEALSDPDNAHVFHVTRCSACHAQLDLPSVHFMCDHSYHQRCIAEHETECPNCAQEHGVIREIRRNNERLADQHDVFLSEVKEGGFEAVAGAFGRGLMNMGRVEEVV
ncbi:uncharacterized protein LACBIDRAFT_251110, partial [Laccaria bicolor S238N-H82]